MRFTALWLVLICAIFGVIQLFGFTELLILIKPTVQYWRYITSLFVHGSVGHFLSNMFALALFGLMLEGRIGSKRVLYIFLVAGILANLLSPYERSLGASGAIYGLIGTLALLRPFMVMWISGMPMPMIVACFIYFIQDFGGLFTASNIGHAAHLWGLAVGIIAGLYLRKKFGDRKQKKKKKYDPNLEKQIDVWENRFMR